jgi:hypothetical protein
MNQLKQTHDGSPSGQMLSNKATESPSLAKNKTVICKALVDAGIETLTLTYDGWSDSGEITSTVVKPDSCVLPDVLVDVDVIFHRYDDTTEAWIGRAVPKQQKLSEAVRYFLEYATTQHGFRGWEDGTGSAGTLVLNARDSSYELSHCNDIEYNRKVKRSFEVFQG